MRESLKLVIRDPSDIEKERKMITPCPETILRNTDTFRRQWGNTSVKGQLVLPEDALKALDNLRNLAEKGCLSDTPVSCGTDRNENLHKSVKRTIKQGKIGSTRSFASRIVFLQMERKETKVESSRMTIVKFFGVHTTI